MCLMVDLKFLVCDYLINPLKQRDYLYLQPASVLQKKVSVCLHEGAISHPKIKTEA
jgi:hypothetical protein